MRILIVTTKQPSTNPRMRKAADALANAGHRVHVLYAFNAAWASKADQDILESCKWTFEQVGGDPITQARRYTFSRLRRKWAEKTNRLEKAWCRSHNEYVKKGIAFQPNLVIGHNPGALSPITSIAQALNIPSMFDAEDYHRGEQDATSMHSRQVTTLEDRFIPKLSAMTAASPMIGEAYSKLYPKITITTVNNAFPKDQLRPISPSHEGPLRMVWFSQVVGLDRGLEPFLRGMSLAADIPLELTIIGQCPPDVKNELQSNRTAHKHTIHFKEPMNERNLFAYLQNMEIGLALEPGFSQNNLLARSNKIYNYVVAGCFTVFSSTPAQVDFLRTYPTTGIEVNLNSPESVQSALTIIWSHRKKLLERRMSIWSLGQNQLNWDKESRVLLNAVREYLHSK